MPTLQNSACCLGQYYGNTSPTSTVFSVGSDGDVHGASGESVIAYCFHSVDGFSDMGIYGGAVPFFEGTPANSRYRYFPMPWVPAVLDMNITNSTVLPNGTLEVDFISRKQD